MRTTGPSTVTTPTAGGVRPTTTGLGIVTMDSDTGTRPARLPREGRPDGRPGPAGHPRRLIARAGGEYLFVGVRGGSGTLPAREPAPDVFLGPGDICFYDVHEPPRLDLPRGCRLKVFLLARELLGLARSDVPRVTSVPVAPTSGLGALLSPFLSDVADTLGASRPPVGEMLAWNAVNLLATLATEHLAEQARDEEPDTRAVLVPDILDHIDRHLTDTDLSPETIARAHHISVRYLHKLFEDEGTTVARLIRRRRLAECRRALTLRSWENVTIAAIANHWGFASPTHFSRVFRAAYGMSPREWRDVAGSGAALDGLGGSGAGRGGRETGDRTGRAEAPPEAGEPRPGG
ncbi:helix-turn-helix domain-containing protein [Streptomyces sp. Go40/10]|uniref:helix-turn-helix domain-containing protein n=1 Tax=Streptomyces sp. Go40/10 TaxID=2825844 RepID=UPI001E3632A7|nr:helix-turn-helix domain-containing protein [Streptomyces sp. Go40/10]UFR06646.1 helix-turn-helix domain-containing protein [Streptomyces sp. Go40/10]